MSRHRQDDVRWVRHIRCLVFIIHSYCNWQASLPFTWTNTLDHSDAHHWSYCSHIQTTWKGALCLLTSDIHGTIQLLWRLSCISATRRDAGRRKDKIARETAAFPFRQFLHSSHIHFAFSSIPCLWLWTSLSDCKPVSNFQVWRFWEWILLKLCNRYSGLWNSSHRAVSDIAVSWAHEILWAEAIRAEIWVASFNSEQSKQFSARSSVKRGWSNEARCRLLQRSKSESVRRELYRHSFVQFTVTECWLHELTTVRGA